MRSNLLYEVYNSFIYENDKYYGGVLTFSEWKEYKYFEESSKLKYRELESNLKKWLIYGTVGVGFGLLGLTATYLYRKLSDTCYKKCGNDTFCKINCNILAGNKLITVLEKDKQKIKAAKNLTSDTKITLITKVDKKIDEYKQKIIKLKIRAKG